MVDRDIHSGRGWFSIDFAPSSSFDPYLPELANKKATSKEKTKEFIRYSQHNSNLNLMKYTSPQGILTVNLGDKVYRGKI